MMLQPVSEVIQINILCHRCGRFFFYILGDLVPKTCVINCSKWSSLKQFAFTQNFSIIFISNSLFFHWGTDDWMSEQAIYLNSNRLKTSNRISKFSAILVLLKQYAKPNPYSKYIFHVHCIGWKFLILDHTSYRHTEKIIIIFSNVLIFFATSANYLLIA